MAQLLLGLLTLSGLTALLAVFLEAADSYFADYGECTIRINEGDKELTVEGGNKLLSSLMDAGIFIPSACGGRGSCGLCKLKVLEGGGPILPTETPYMEPDELQAHVRLSCQVKVRNDLTIQIPPELFLIRAYRTRVAGLRDLTHLIREVHLQLEDPPEMVFKPGQYIQFEVPAYEGSPEPVYRAYSLASAASDRHSIKLAITRVENGLATTYVHRFLRPGDEVTINGPYGDFYLREGDRDMVMIGTGSGLAPLLSILYQMAEAGSERKVTLFFGVKEKKDLFYQDEIHSIAQKLPHFRYVPVLSEPVAEDQWQGATGYVTDVMAEQVQDGSNAEAYLCGNPLMIDAAVKLLQQIGVTEDRIFFDKFA